jgi:hypothetical protein
VLDGGNARIAPASGRLHGPDALEDEALREPSFDGSCQKGLPAIGGAGVFLSHAGCADQTGSVIDSATLCARFW